MAEYHLADDRDAVAPVKGDSSDVEDTCDGSIGAQTDEVDGDAEEDGDPDGVKRGIGQSIDFGPDVRKGNQAIAGEGK